MNGTLYFRQTLQVLYVRAALSLGRMAVARREEGPSVGYGHLRSPYIAYRAAMAAFQVATLVLHDPHF